MFGLGIGLGICRGSTLILVLWIGFGGFGSADWNVRMMMPSGSNDFSCSRYFQQNNWSYKTQNYSEAFDLTVLID